MSLHTPGSVKVGLERCKMLQHKTFNVAFKRFEFGKQAPSITCSDRPAVHGGKMLLLWHPDPVADLAELPLGRRHR